MLILLLISVAASAVVFFLVLPIGVFWALGSGVAAGAVGIFAGAIWSVYRQRRAQGNETKGLAGFTAEVAKQHPEILEPRTPPAV